MRSTPRAEPCIVRLKRPHLQQQRFLRSPAPRRIICAGRRSGKTTGLAIAAVEAFLAGQRVLYAVPTTEQINRWWHEVTTALQQPVLAGLFKKNETEHTIELPFTEQRLKGKTAYNADTLRGDFADLLILDEFSLMNEDAWEVVGAPMLLDRRGRVLFCFTPPSLRVAGVTKAHDRHYAAKLFKQAQLDTSGRWEAFRFTSHENPHISAEALGEISSDMTDLAYRQEIGAELIEDIPGALWTHRLLDRTRITAEQCPALVSLAVALDPSATSQATSDEMGLIAAGRDANGQGYLLRDASMRGTPAACARQAILLYDSLEADVMVAEVNNGGEWIGTVINFVAAEMARNGERPATRIRYKMIHASRGKQTRAQPVATEYEHARCHHVGIFPELEDEMCGWVPGMDSPNRMDAAVWALTELLLLAPRPAKLVELRF